MKNPPVLQEDHPMPTAPVEDEEAELEAARHRYHASMLVRDHLERHAANNPGASSDYVTWIATLHPENADVTIDQRFFVPGNPWWTIYEDTKNDQIPTATAVPLPDNDDVEQGTQRQGEAATNSEANPANSGQTARQEVHCCNTCSPLSILFAITVFIPASIGVFIAEMMALCVYFLGKFFYHISESFSPPNCCTCLFFVVFRFSYIVCAFCDSIALMISVIVTEVVGIVAYLVGFCTGGPLWARNLHQQTRRMCHGIRIMFRKNGVTANPPRKFFCHSSSIEGNEDESVDNSTNTRPADPVASNTNNNVDKNGASEPVVSATIVKD
jgi:hypothetical protein